MEAVIFSLKFILMNLSASGPGCGLEHAVHVNINVLAFTTLLRHLLPQTRNVSRKDRGVNIRGGHLTSLISSCSL